MRRSRNESSEAQGKANKRLQKLASRHEKARPGESRKRRSVSRWGHKQLFDVCCLRGNAPLCAGHVFRAHNNASGGASKNRWGRLLQCRLKTARHIGSI
jgi:hypothetical protein